MPVAVVAAWVLRYAGSYAITEAQMLVHVADEEGAASMRGDGDGEEAAME